MSAKWRIRADALDEARRMHGFTSDEKLAAELGMSGTAVRSLRRGITSPSIATLMKLRRLTGIPVEALVREEKPIAA